MRHISAAGTTTPGAVATVAMTGDTTEHIAADQETDTFSWTDAARWSPAQAQVARTEDESNERDRLNALFCEIPDQEIGSTENIGWFGLLKREGQPSGIVLSRNAYRFRYVWQTSSDEQLAQHWEQLRREHNAFIVATRARSRESDDRSNDDDDQPHLDGSNETESGHHPEIWVGSLSDYNNGRLYGAWLDATLDPDELHHAVEFHAPQRLHPRSRRVGHHGLRRLLRPQSWRV